MKPIVVPVNFSNNSSNAARYAVDLALAIGADLRLVYVLEFPATVTELPMPEYVFEEMQRSGQILLQTLTDELVKRTKGQVNVLSDMEVGGVEYHLEKYCYRTEPFLVVMGASGHTLDTVLEGSNTVRAMRGIPYPLLIIPEKAVFHTIKEIVLACEPEDVGADLPGTLPFLKELHDLFDAHFNVISVSTKDISEGINAYLGKENADWLIVFPKKHTFFEFHNSKSKKIARHCPVPVMSVHE
jgi:nucleotide-binding universal stress UspA family protein